MQSVMKRLEELFSEGEIYGLEIQMSEHGDIGCWINKVAEDTLSDGVGDTPEDAIASAIRKRFGGKE